MNNLFFQKALPVWAQNREKEKNCRMRIRAKIPLGHNSMCRIATSGIYNLYINGKFLSYGPARAGKGFFRVDEIDLTQFIKHEENVLVIDVSGYCVDSFYIQEQPSFIQAEILYNGTAVFYTGANGGFEAQIHPAALRRVQRYSFQRPFLEAYHYKKPDRFPDGKDIEGAVFLEELEQRKLLPRLVPYPGYEELEAVPQWQGEVKIQKPSNPKRDRNILNVDGVKLKGFPLCQLEFCANDEARSMIFDKKAGMCEGKALKKDEFCLYKFPWNATGMLHVSVICEKSVCMYLLFDEVLVDGDISLDRCDCTNVIRFLLEPGEYHLRVFEVYTMKYVKVVSMEGDCLINSLGLTEYKHPPVHIKTPMVEKDPVLNKIKEAAIETFRQNAVDLFTDCPSRERAGWLCDSFFTARTEYVLTGQSRLEHNFLENYLYEEHDQALPEGMLPMCYPADHNDGNFIVNWALWLILELEEYKWRSRDLKLPELFRSRILKLFQYLKKFENEDGLLEDIPGWIFVEWSRANDLTSGVNYPSNFLYGAALAAAGRLYSDKEMLNRSLAINHAVIVQSFHNGWFMDHAIRKEGRLTLVEEATEVCQYYAFFFEAVSPETHRELFQTLLTEFNPDQRKAGVHPEIAKANSFVGNYMRLELLMRYGYYKEARSNIRDYFGMMAEKTGTLWEHDKEYASCCHGFASYVLCWLQELENKMT